MGQYGSWILSGLVLISLLSVLSVQGGGQETDWTEMAPAVAPSARHEHNVAYDAESDRVILFGGLTVGPPTLRASDETWAYDFNSNTWSLMQPPTSPSPRFMHAMAYDAESDRVILFGGIFKAQPETWAYDFNADTWTNMTPAVQPAGYVNSRMVYDSESDRIILFGGDTENTPIHQSPTDETWSYNFDANTWTQMNPSAFPSARMLHGMAYDGASDRLILFGGGDAVSDFGDTWAYDFDSDRWTLMSPPQAPSARHGPGMGYDALSDRAVLFGGITGSDETWVYDFDNDTWSQTERGTGPAPRRTPNLAYDEKSERIFLFGGVQPLTVDQFYGDTWSYRFTVAPSPLTTDLTFTPAAPQAGESITFAANPTGGTGPYAHSWVWGDGTPSGSGPNPSHAYANAETFTVTLTTTDSMGHTATTSEDVLVTAAPQYNTALVLGLSGAAVVGAAVVGFLLLRRRKERG